jgi:hypothetical protein
MPRYFFTIHGRKQVEDNPAGAYLPDAKAALSCAAFIIRELRKNNDYVDDPSLMMIIKDEVGQTVSSLPFFPGC